VVVAVKRALAAVRTRDEYLFSVSVCDARIAFVLAEAASKFSIIFAVVAEPVVSVEAIEAGFWRECVVPPRAHHTVSQQAHHVAFHLAVIA